MRLLCVGLLRFWQKTNNRNVEREGMGTMSDFNPDIKAIKKLATLLSETGLSEIEYAEGDKRIRCVRTITAGEAMVAPMPVVPAAPMAAEITAKPVVPVGTPVTAPMVGTVYLSPEPGAPPFVRVGDRVKKGDTLLIIEAMKVMNPIKASANGEIAQILVSDAKPVEYGEILMSLV